MECNESKDIYLVYDLTKYKDEDIKLESITRIILKHPHIGVNIGINLYNKRNKPWR